MPARSQSGAEAPHGSPWREGCAVEANVTPHQAVLPNRDAARLRIAVVSGVRFLREGLAEIFKVIRWYRSSGCAPISPRRWR